MKLDKYDLGYIIAALEGFEAILNKGAEVTAAAVNVGGHSISIVYDDENSVWYVNNIKEISE